MDQTIDIKENFIYDLDKELLEILLKDRSSKKNIIWATDNYENKGKGYQFKDHISIKAITGKNGLVIKPRTKKSKKEQEKRIKEKAEVFTPSWICNNQNNVLCDAWFNKKNVFNKECDDNTWETNKEKIEFPNDKTWKDFVSLKVLEITCGEAPYLVSRYDTVTGEWINANERIGALDRKIRVINENVDDESEWCNWVIIAFKCTFGYEWQGDSLLIARENILFSFIDYYYEKFSKYPSKDKLLEIGKIISWNIFQMDGLKYVIPESCVQKESNQLSIFDEDIIYNCPGCEKKDNSLHTGIYSKFMNWGTNRSIKFWKGEKRMKFDYVIGNPPYQGEGRQQIYTFFYKSAIKIGKNVCLIFPTGWQEPKNANSLSNLNNKTIKEDKQIVYINNLQNAFPGITGAEWTNIIFWKAGYDNGLDGKQLIYTNGENPKEVLLKTEKKDIEKPKELVRMAECVGTSDFNSIQNITSVRKPYGLSTDYIKDPKKYNLPPFKDTKQNDDDIVLYTKKGDKKYLSHDFPFPRKGAAFESYKVFVPYAWGGMDEKQYLGGSYSDIIIANPYEACTETYLESGNFADYETAKKHAKYLFTKFLRALLYLNKFSQHSTTAWAEIPMQTYEEDWWNLSIEKIDEKLFEKYNLPEDVRSFVRKNIQPKDESCIKNYK